MMIDGNPSTASKNVQLGYEGMRGSVHNSRLAQW